jgi:maltose alpha-D-glucosyltransferase/alpha-amylase
VLRYGEEIGMGEDLSLNGREAIRTPMQWSFQPNAGFSTADPEKLVRPVIDKGDFSYEKVNVTAQRSDPRSLLSWFERMIRTLREAPEIGSGTTAHIDVPMPAGVLAHRADGPTGTMVFLHNLGTSDVEVDLSLLQPEADLPIDVLSDRGYGDVGKLDRLKLSGQGYRWIRLCRGSGF